MNNQTDIKKQRLSSKSQVSKPGVDTQNIDEILWTIIDRKFDALKSEIKAEIANHLYRQSIVTKVKKGAQEQLNTHETSQSKCSASKSLLNNKSWKKNLFRTGTATQLGKKSQQTKPVKKDIGKAINDQRLKSKTMASSMTNFKPKSGNKWLSTQQTKPQNKVLPNNNGTLILDQPIEDLYYSMKERVAERCIANVPKADAQLYVNEFQPPAEEMDLNVLNHSFEDFLSIKKDSNKKAEAQTTRESMGQASRISNYANFQHFLSSQRDKANDSANSVVYQPASFRNRHMETIAETPDVVNNSMMLVEERIDEESVKSKSDPVSSSNTGNSHYVFGKGTKPPNLRRESIRDQYERRESLLKTTGMLFTFERKQRNSAMDLSVESKEINNLEL